ncbi:MAG: bifunctional oligoribonuclease/PAP phosphatase NrnA [Verrucomicrobiota bacterium]
MTGAKKFYPDFAPRFASLLAALSPGRYAVIGHARPDGDCIGSQVALARALRASGREVVCVNTDPVPRRLQFCVGDTPFFRAAALPAGDWTALYVDCADLARAGDRLAARFPAPLASLDHHLSNPGFATYNFVDTGSAAACEILAGLLLDAGLPVDATAAQALYTGISTDTGQFRFHSTSRRTFVLAAGLLERGADPAAASAELYERETAGKLQLLQRFLASFKLECGGRVCVGVLPAGTYEATGTNPEDTEGMVDYARGIDGVDIGVLIEERADGIKASLRGKNPGLRLDRVAAQFNGGGHACAAGLNVKGATLATFRAQLTAALSAQIAAVDAAKKTS